MRASIATVAAVALLALPAQARPAGGEAEPARGGQSPALTVRLEARPPFIGGFGTDGLAVGVAAHLTHASGMRAGFGALGVATIDAGTSVLSPYLGFELGARNGEHQWQWTLPVLGTYRYFDRGAEGGSSKVEHGVGLELAAEATRWSRSFGFQLRTNLTGVRLFTNDVDKMFWDGGVSVGVAWRTR